MLKVSKIIIKLNYQLEIKIFFLLVLDIINQEALFFQIYVNQEFMNIIAWRKMINL